MRYVVIRGQQVRAGSEEYRRLSQGGSVNASFRTETRAGMHSEGGGDHAERTTQRGTDRGMDRTAGRDAKGAGMRNGDMRGDKAQGGIRNASDTGGGKSDAGKAEGGRTGGGQGAGAMNRN